MKPLTFHCDALEKSKTHTMHTQKPYSFERFNFVSSAQQFFNQTANVRRSLFEKWVSFNRVYMT